jgi:hypothetical protein
MKPMRRADWPERLFAFVESRRSTPFAYGSNDCCLFAADAVLAMTDVDVAAKWRGHRTERQALARIKKAGGLRQLVTTMGIEEKPTGFAQRGNPVVAVLDERETLGIYVGGSEWCGPGASGLVFRPMHDVTAVFDI